MAAKRAKPENRREYSEYVLSERRPLAKATGLNGFVGNLRHIIKLLEPRLATGTGGHGRHACDEICRVVTGYADHQRQKYRREPKRGEYDEC